MARLAAESSACLTIFKDVPVLATNSPNKLFDTFAAGRAAIVNMDGWMRELVERNDAGVYVRAGDAADLAEKVAWLRDNPDEVAADGRERAGARRARVRPRRARGARARGARGGGALTELSYCVVNTSGRDYLLACLAAIERTHPEGVEHEVLVLDNASDDGSAEAVRERHPEARLFALERRTGKAENDSTLLREARGRYCLLLNEDSELRDGRRAGAARRARRRSRRRGRRRAAARLGGRPVPCAWRLPDIPWALAAAVFLHDRVAVQSTGERVREVGWVQSSAALVRREAAEQVGWLDPDFFVYSDETDFCKRLHDAGWRILFVPAARAVHHNQLSTDAAAMSRRIVEFHRNRDLYFRKHGLRRAPGSRGRCAGPGPTSCAPRRAARAARARPAPLPAPRPPGAVPGRGEGIRDAAEARNRALANNVPARHGAR